MADGEYKPGLEGVPATRSNISFVDGQAGILEYRGIPIQELTAHSTFLETAYLLIFGELPTQSDLHSFEQAIRGHRRVKYRIRDMIKSFPESGHPMDALQTCVAGLGLFYPLQDVDPNYVFGTVTRLLSKLPTMVAMFHQMRQGNDPIPPDDSLDHSANFLYMLSGKKPDPWLARIFDTCLILHAEHTVNASTFALLVSASTLANPYSTLATAVGTLSGLLHGGANQQVMTLLRQIGSVENVRSFIEDKLAKKQRIMGLGHRVYKVKDPRAITLQRIAEELFERYGHDKYYDIAVEIERVCEELLGPKGIYPNVDFYSGLVYAKLGIPEDLFTPVFAIARAAGWLAHWREQLSDNRLFRPTQVYTGERNQRYIPLAERG
ncbi:citrate synthase [Synechococcus sp. Nb3U1]|uniref:citrate synthase n=1 Tax=Synechococcus sp. Nb3U1 TaxID=1914529 RepID=UPI001F35F789|nr:citrate synthase [Synechococcus sp. Nb3U1]MCF2971806.1 citrate synthase [Synechococcus sp. Nb3U1]